MDNLSVDSKSDSHLKRCFASMPNFRQLSPSSDDRDVNSRLACPRFTLKLYRSSRPDFLTPEEVDQFTKLGIRSIIDFRSTVEYRNANGEKLLDAVFPVYKVKLLSRYKPGDKVQCKLVKISASTSSSQRHDSLPKHYLINFFRMNYIKNVFFRAPWYICLYSLLFLLIDIVLCTGYKYFVRVFARHVLNKTGLRGQYIDMLTFSQASICAALKLLTEPENVPAMLNCAHGKDRTGLVSALVLSVLGWSNDAIAYDYHQSEMELSRMRDRLHDEIVTRFHMCQSFMTAKSETMLVLLRYIDDSYGSVANYLESIGFSLDDQKRLRMNLMSAEST